MDINDIRKRLIYRSWHRGTREMDLLMGSFADQYVPGFSDTEMAEYDHLLSVSDPDLYDWVSGQVDPPANMSGPVLGKLLNHIYPLKTGKAG